MTCIDAVIIVDGERRSMNCPTGFRAASRFLLRYAEWLEARPVFGVGGFELGWADEGSAIDGPTAEPCGQSDESGAGGRPCDGEQAAAQAAGACRFCGAELRIGKNGTRYCPPCCAKRRGMRAKAAEPTLMDLVRGAIQSMADLDEWGVSDIVAVVGKTLSEPNYGSVSAAIRERAHDCCERVGHGRYRTRKAPAAEVVAAEVVAAEVVAAPRAEPAELSDNRCGFCGGSGVTNKPSFGTTVCTGCDGTGKRDRRRRPAAGARGNGALALACV